ncbi:carbohydrate ABC transporter permease [Clostridium lacusfryxellense]|uniref:carbohydrate ABC transporter permease n=1 Tax=Clostridium lacusfryxellense TaxID=205328 RepID=UPI001C0E4067|nr:carbohydrate ABC transporter permease [Clostridium lacusfryxellense]MBU3112573.1 carbohydrate ABC transporter permease [Clostridium lacusfryxellense]
MKSKRNYSGVVITIFSLILAFVFVIPLIWMVFVSLRHEGDIINNVLSWFKPPYSLMTYPKVLRTSGMTTWIFNSLFISVVSTIATVTVSSMAAYALSKVIKGKYNKYIMLFILFGLMLPGEATIIPLYQIIKNFNLLDSYAGIILPGLASPMAVIILKGFFDGVPSEILDSASIDGCGLFRSFTSIVLPLAKPALASIAILTFIGSWNNFLWPFLCVTSEKLYTIPLGIPIFNSNYTNGYVLPMTVNSIASIPVIIVFILFEKQIIKGVTMSGIKG